MSNFKVLLVDDEPDIIQSVSMRLKSKGYIVTSAVNGAQAVSIALEEVPDLIILDIGLPEGDGHFVARQLLDFPQTKFIPIIYLTASTSEYDFSRAVSVGGACKYITKPFKSKELMDAVEVTISEYKRFFL